MIDQPGTRDRREWTMNFYEITGLGRPLDPRHRSNRVAIGLTTLSGLVTSGLTWVIDGQLDVRRGVSVAIGVFLAWALGRELDPDRPSSATIAMIIAWVAGVFSSPALIAVAVVLFGVRILAGTVGARLRTVDLLLLLAASALAGTEPVAWPAVAVLAFAVWKDPSATHPGRAWAIGATATAAALLSGVQPDPGLPGLGGLLLLIGVVVVGLARRHVTSVESMCDAGHTRVDAGAVSLARVAATVAVMGGVVIAPNLALTLGPAAASILALARPTRRDERAGGLPETQPVDQTGPEFVAPHPLGAGTIPPVL